MRSAPLFSAILLVSLTACLKSAEPVQEGIEAEVPATPRSEPAEIAAADEESVDDGRATATRTATTTPTASPDPVAAAPIGGLVATGASGVGTRGEAGGAVGIASGSTAGADYAAAPERADAKAKREMAPAKPAIYAAAPPPAGPMGVAVPMVPPMERPALDAVSTEDFTDYGVANFFNTAEDPLSTFAIDVDTASYTITRSKLVAGYLPPQSAVRVEEFVNYFPYEYKQPKAGEPFAVDFEAAPSPYNPQNHLVRVGVQGKKVAADQRKPVHLTLLIDTSGSMQADNKIGLLKRTMKTLVAELEDGDTVAIATYAGNTSIALQPTPIAREADIMRALDRLTAGGSTAMGAGIDLAYQLADQSFRDDAVNRVVICSDGDANVGQTSHAVLSQQIRGYAKKGITLTTVGFGNGNYKDTMMEQLANDGDGNYYYIDSEQEARRVFVDKLTGTMEVIAKDVKIQVEWNPGEVVAYRLIGYENRDVADRDFRNDAVDAGEIGAGHQVTALYEVVLRNPAPTGNLATVRVRNKAPGADSPAVERSYALPGTALRPSFSEASAQMRLTTAAAGFAEILRGSPHMNEVSLREVEAIAKKAARAEYREDAELVQLIGIAANLKGQALVSQR